MVQSVAVDAAEGPIEGSERERIIRKIKRCLALGESSNSNEAEMALRQAQSLMRQHRLTEADIHADAVSCEKRDTGLVRMADWQRSLANTAAQAFGCRMLMEHKVGGPMTFLFVGVRPASDLAAYAYDALLAQVKLARKHFQKRHKSGRREADDFCLAWVLAVKEKVQKFAKDNPLDARKTYALVVVEQREQVAINTWIANQYKDVGTRNQKKKESYSPLAMTMGYRAGQDAQINQAVSKTVNESNRIGMSSAGVKASEQA